MKRDVERNYRDSMNLLPPEKVRALGDNENCRLLSGVESPGTGTGESTRIGEGAGDDDGEESWECMLGSVGCGDGCLS
jgi:hypothetical protein